MSGATQLNKNNSAVKRILQEAKELANDSCTDYTAAPLEDDIFEWHCTIRGPSGTEFEGGLYHFRILLPSEYPFRPPSIMMLTPNGRFELNTKICISFTSYHEESWQPAWGVRTAILGLQGFFPLKGKAALGIGGLETPVSDRKRLAALSRNWVCPRCQQTNLECMPDLPATTASPSSQQSLVSPPLTASPPVSSDIIPVTDIPADEPNFDIPSSLSPPSTEAEILSPSAPSTVRSSDHTEDEPATNNHSPGVAVTNSPIKSPRPPVLLDTAICVLLVLVFALIYRRVL